MICQDTQHDCDNPGCRHGGCQGRRPVPPLLRGLDNAAGGQTLDNALLGAVETARPRAVATTLLLRRS